MSLNRPTGAELLSEFLSRYLHRKDPPEVRARLSRVLKGEDSFSSDELHAVQRDIRWWMDPPWRWPPSPYWPLAELSLEQSAIPEHEFISPKTEDPDAAFARVEMETILAELLREMPEPTFEVAALRLTGRTHREIAQELGLSVSTVSKRWSRAVKRLREEFRARGLLPDEEA
ncbi:MAG: sigma-70 family RNA polymerase sigma factor [Planctomycetota bacterium]